MTSEKGNNFDIDDLEDILNLDDYMENSESLLRGDSQLADYIYVNNLKQRKLYLDCDISFQSVEDIIANIMNYNKSDKDIPTEERKPIYLYISSLGGEVPAGLALMDVISSSKTPVYTINIGSAYSMAFYIAISGHKRYALNNSTFLLHDGFNSLKLSVAKTQDVFQFQQKQEERLKQYTISHTNITEKDYDGKYRAEWYMYADEAKELGVVDYIIGVDCDLDEIV